VLKIELLAVVCHCLIQHALAGSGLTPLRFWSWSWSCNLIILAWSWSGWSGLDHGLI